MHNALDRRTWRSQAPHSVAFTSGDHFGNIHPWATEASNWKHSCCVHRTSSELCVWLLLKTGLVFSVSISSLCCYLSLFVWWFYSYAHSSFKILLTVVWRNWKRKMQYKTYSQWLGWNHSIIKNSIRFHSHFMTNSSKIVFYSVSEPTTVLKSWPLPLDVLSVTFHSAGSVAWFSFRRCHL